MNEVVQKQIEEKEEARQYFSTRDATHILVRHELEDAVGAEHQELIAILQRDSLHLQTIVKCNIIYCRDELRVCFLQRDPLHLNHCSMQNVL